ncbi:hypothetical protein Y1Q_0010274 [Alligator mississippiensis]|uniref:Uncharacterized protein n=1 Tax=Alligator mississippiensis TaxID=8496 RepID=A0A151P1H1_ALLMI|nr:hypothetical protein Y1Q_0010274 [Alligator mississippiensis]
MSCQLHETFDELQLTEEVVTFQVSAVHSSPPSNFLCPTHQVKRAAQSKIISSASALLEYCITIKAGVLYANTARAGMLLIIAIRIGKLWEKQTR